MFKRFVHSNIGAAVLNMAVAYLVWMLSRVAFFAENWSTFAPYMSWPLFKSMLHGSLVFDTSALLYVNALYLVLMLLPLHLKERAGFHRGLKWLFVVTNAVGIAMNLMDAVYFQYTGRRSTVTVFTEFANEGNITSIILTEFLRHWYLVLAFLALVFILWRCYMKPRLEVYRFGHHYYISQLIALVVMVPLAIVGIRGSVTAGTRPITISNANQFVNRPVEASVVLNTPFSMIRSIGKKAFAGCKALSDVSVESEGIKKIAKSAFKGDNRLKEIHLKKKKYTVTKAKFKAAVKRSGASCVKVSKGNTGRFCLFISL